MRPSSSRPGGDPRGDRAHCTAAPFLSALGSLEPAHGPPTRFLGLNKLLEPPQSCLTAGPLRATGGLPTSPR